MSLEMLAAVWDLDLPRNESDVIEVLAWHANADGICWPSKARIMYKKNLSESTVKRTLRSLKSRGLLSVEANAEGGRGKTPLYKLHPEKGVKKIPFAEWAKGVKQPPKGGQGEHEKGVRAVTPEPTENRQPEPSRSEEHPNGSSSGGEPPGKEDPPAVRPMSYREYAFKRFRELIKEAEADGRSPDPLPNSKLGEYSAFYDQHAKEGADPDDLDDAIRWLVAKASGAVEDESQAWAYFGTAVRASRNGGVRQPLSVIQGGKANGRGVGDGTGGRSSAGYTEGYEFLFDRG